MVEIIRVSAEVMVIVLVFENQGIRVVTAYTRQCGRSLKKEKFYIDIAKGCGGLNERVFDLFR